MRAAQHAPTLRDSPQLPVPTQLPTQLEPEVVEDFPVVDEPAARPTQTSAAFLPPRTWRQLEGVDLEAELRQAVRTVREPPRWFRGPLLQAYWVALQQWARDRSTSSWKLLTLVPRMLLKPTDEHGDAGKQLFFERLRRFNKGEWVELLAEAKQGQRKPVAQELDAEAAAEKRREQAETRVRWREVRVHESCLLRAA